MYHSEGAHSQSPLDVNCDLGILSRAHSKDLNSQAETNQDERLDK